jgi:hypothetical protein
LVFDTRGRRKHVVRVVYAILALLMGASLFLVVGPFSLGNLFGTTTSTSPSKVLNEQAERIETRLRTEPDNEDLLLALTRARIGAGKANSEVNPETGVPFITPEGQQQLEQAAVSWNRYVKKANPVNPSAAALMAGAFFNLAETSRTLEEATNRVKDAAGAQDIAAKGLPNVGTFSTLAFYQYYAGNFAAGDEATKKAMAKSSSKAEAKEVKKKLAEYRSRGEAFEKQKKEYAKLEKSQSKEALKNPLGSLGGSSGSLGQ